MQVVAALEALGVSIAQRGGHFAGVRIQLHDAVTKIGNVDVPARIDLQAVGLAFVLGDLLDGAVR